MNNPCHKYCPERVTGCHISCERYERFRKSLDEKNAEIRKLECIADYHRRKNITSRALKIRLTIRVADKIKKRSEKNGNQENSRYVVLDGREGGLLLARGQILYVIPADESVYYSARNL